MPRDPVRDPCPGSNGGTVGAVEPFTLLCGVDLVGDDIGSVPADNITQCADACAVYQHPRCAAVAFEASQAHGTSNCYLKSAVPTPTVQTFVMDAAVAAGPTATEDCAALGPTHTAQARVLFRTYCGYDYQRDDLVQSFAADMGACMDQCVQHNTAAAAGSCLGVAYEASQLTGFQNCYLKDGNNTADLVSPAFVVDAAFIVGTAALPTTSPAGASTPSPSPSPSSSPSPSPSIAWIAGPIVGGRCRTYPTRSCSALVRGAERLPGEVAVRGRPVTGYEGRGRAGRPWRARWDDSRAPGSRALQRCGAGLVRQPRLRRNALRYAGDRHMAVDEPCQM